MALLKAEPGELPDDMNYLGDCLESSPLLGVIRRKCAADGVSAGTFWGFHDKFVMEVRQRYVGLQYSEEWRQLKVHNLLWEYLFPHEAFPGKVPPPVSASCITAPAPVLIQKQSDNASYGCLSPHEEDESVLNRPVPSFSISVQQNIMAMGDGPKESLYASCMELMRNKAILNSISIDQFVKTSNQKAQIAQKRFPLESSDWQDWFAESLTWSCFFKNDTHFPGKEPARLFPLFSDGRSSPQHKLVAEKRKKPVRYEDVLDNVPAGFGGKRQKTGTSTISMEKNNPTDPFVGQESRYQTLERLMEAKAKAAGGLARRGKFFVYLQGMRDLANKEHKNCSKQFKSWFSDRRTWDHFFKNEQFPGKEPTGPGIHKGHPVQRLARRGPASASPNSIAGVDVSKSLISYSSPTAVQRIPRPLASDSGHNSRNLALSLKPTDGEIPRDIMESLYARNRKGNYRHDDRVLMIDKVPFSYSKDDVKQIAKSFRSIDPETKRTTEKALGCVLRCRLLESGDVILFCLPEIYGDKVAVDRGIKFLMDWERKDFAERNAGRLLDFLQASKEFNDPARVVDSGLHSHQILINGKAIQFPRRIIDGICDSFSKDIDGRNLIEKTLNCSFSLVDPSKEHAFKTLKVTAPDTVKSPDERTTLVRNGYKFLEAWLHETHKCLVFKDMCTLPISEYHKKYNAQNGDHDSARLLVVHREDNHTVDCSDLAMKNISFLFLIDHQKSIAENALQCRFVVHERPLNEGMGLTFQVLPLDDLICTQVGELATQFLLDWFKQALRDEKLKMSNYWKRWSYLRGVQAASDSSSRISRMPLATLFKPVAVADPEHEWEKYANAFGASNIDRLVIEEQVKAEGKLRIVLDEETQDIVTLGELEARIELRSQEKRKNTNSPASVGTSFDNGKRKPEALLSPLDDGIGAPISEESSYMSS